MYLHNLYKNTENVLLFKECHVYTKLQRANPWKVIMENPFPQTSRTHFLRKLTSARHQAWVVVNRSHLPALHRRPPAAGWPCGRISRPSGKRWSCRHPIRSEPVRVTMAVRWGSAVELVVLGIFGIAPAKTKMDTQNDMPRNRLNQPTNQLTIDCTQMAGQQNREKNISLPSILMLWHVLCFTRP